MRSPEHVICIPLHTVCFGARACKASDMTETHEYSALYSSGAPASARCGILVAVRKD